MKKLENVINRTTSAGRSSGISSSMNDQILAIKNKYNFDNSYNLSGHLEGVCLFYAGEKESPSKLTNIQQRERYKNISEAAAHLNGLLEKLGNDEILAISKQSYERNKRNINNMIKLDPTTDVSKLSQSFSYSDLIQDLTKYSLPNLVYLNQQAVSEIIPTEKRGKIKDDLRNNLLYRLIDIYTTGTNKSVSYTRETYESPEPYSGVTVEFCMDILDIILPTENISNQTIGDKIRNYNQLG